MMSTLKNLPGYRVVATHGVVTELAAASGFTATTKGSTAPDSALVKLGRSAAAAGGNAILGLRHSTFGAGGGITNSLGGDAVGVMLMGTAVTVESTQER